MRSNPSHFQILPLLRSIYIVHVWDSLRKTQKLLGTKKKTRKKASWMKEIIFGIVAGNRSFFLEAKLELKLYFFVFEFFSYLNIEIDFSIYHLNKFLLN